MSVFDAFDLGNLAINFLAQGEVGISLPIDSTCNPFRLFGSSFHAITAAWATLGYYAQSDVLYYMHLGWEKFSILLYTVAGIAGLIMMAMGQPPRNWLWFFIGPGIYYFAIDTPAQVHGVAWMVGPYMQPQNEVWRLAESGAVNMGVTRRGAIRFDKNGPYGGTGPNALPGGLVEVSLPFVMLDSFLSDTVRQLSVWTGALSQSNPYLELGVPNSADTNVALESTAPNFMFGEALGSNEVCQDSQNHFATFTNSKWTFLNNVTQAELTNSDARDALSRFVADECGEHLTKAIDFTEFARATNYTESFLPDTVFNQRGAAGAGFSRLYKTLRMELAQTTVPTPTSLKNLLTDSVDNAIPTLTNGSSFVRSVEWLPNGPGNLCGRDQEAVPNALAVVNAILERDRIPCDAYFYVLLLYFRYEAAIIFSQSFQNGGPGGWYPEDMTYNILYGWDIPFNDTGLCSAKHPRGFSVPGQYQFVYNLILAHLFRNELNRLPELVSVGKDKTETILDDSQLYNSTIGSTSKAAEVYTWSLMIPYVQGILLYMLSLAFPIVCMVMLVPSWNKIIITWTSFFVWVKLWDLGFAFVSSLERSLWAMMANSNSSYLINQKVLEMSDYGGFNDLRCVANWPITGGGGTRRVLEPIEKCISNFGANAQPALILTEGPGWCQGATDYGACLNVFDANVTPANPLLNDSAFDATLRLFDLSLIVGSSLDFDLANGYYIYIMSALYFAVPAVTGQMVLGAKSGVAGMVDKIAGDPAGKAAGAAGSSFTGNEAARMKQNAASVSQETNATDQRSTGLVHRALDQQNAAATHSLAASHMGQAGEGARRIAGAVSHGNQAASKDVALIAGVVKAAVGSQSRPIIKSPNMGPPAGTTTASNIGNDAVNRHRPDDADGQNRPGVPLGAMPSAARDVPEGPGGGGGGGTTNAPIQGLDRNGQPITSDSGGFNTDLRAGAVMSSMPTRDANRFTGQVSNPRSAGARFMNALSGATGIADYALDTAVSLAPSAFDRERTHQTVAADNEATARSGALGIDAHASNQLSSGFRSASDRTMASANFSAATKNYEKMNRFAQQRSGRMAALGLPPGMLAPDRRPEDAMGMAMAGMLDAPGRATRQAANFFNPEGGLFLGMVRNSQSGLHNSFGYQRVHETFTQKRGTMIENASSAVGALQRSVTEIGAEGLGRQPRDQRSGSQEKS